MDTTLAIAQAQGECLRQARSTITELEDEVRRLRASEAALAQRLGDTERELDSVARLCTLARDKSAAEQQAREKLQHSLEVTHAKYVRARDALRQAGDELNRSTEESASVREEYSASLDSVRRWKEKLMASKTASDQELASVRRENEVLLEQVAALSGELSAARARHADEVAQLQFERAQLANDAERAANGAREHAMEARDAVVEAEARAEGADARCERLTQLVALKEQELRDLRTAREADAARWKAANDELSAALARQTRDSEAHSERLLDEFRDRVGTLQREHEEDRAKATVAIEVLRSELESAMGAGRATADDLEDERNRWNAERDNLAALHDINLKRVRESVESEMREALHRAAVAHQQTESALRSQAVRAEEALEETHRSLLRARQQLQDEQNKMAAQYSASVTALRREYDVYMSEAAALPTDIRAALEDTIASQKHRIELLEAQLRHAHGSSASSSPIRLSPSRVSP